MSGKLFHSRSAYHVALLRFPPKPRCFHHLPSKETTSRIFAVGGAIASSTGGSLSNSFCPRGPVAIVFYFAQLGLYEDAPVLPWYYFPKNTQDWRPEKAFGKDWVQGLFNIKHYALKRIAPAVIHPLIHFQLSTNPKGYTEKIRHGPQARPWDMAVGSNHVLGFLKELQLLRGFWRNL